MATKTTGRKCEQRNSTTRLRKGVLRATGVMIWIGALLKLSLSSAEPGSLLRPRAIDGLVSGLNNGRKIGSPEGDLYDRRTKQGDLHASNERAEQRQFRNRRRSLLTGLRFPLAQLSQLAARARGRKETCCRRAIFVRGCSKH